LIKKEAENLGKKEEYMSDTGKSRAIDEYLGISFLNDSD
jgi:hypothetical protein